jgi:hypothetical protein
MPGTVKITLMAYKFSEQNMGQQELEQNTKRSTLLQMLASKLADLKTMEAETAAAPEDAKAGLLGNLDTLNNQRELIETMIWAQDVSS